jgi:antitoxin component HigA of HigAB toxin-antitoxin module
MNTNPIRTEQDYLSALAEIDRLFDAQPGSEALEPLPGGRSRALQIRYTSPDSAALRTGL